MNNCIDIKCLIILHIKDKMLFKKPCIHNKPSFQRQSFMYLMIYCNMYTIYLMEIIKNKNKNNKVY